MPGARARSSAGARAWPGSIRGRRWQPNVGREAWERKLDAECRDAETLTVFVEKSCEYTLPTRVARCRANA